MDKIICLVGPSGSGKTTIAKELEKLGYNIIHSYTTRKPREPNEWGHTFVDRNELAQAPFNIIAIGKRPELMIAGEELYGELYFATKEQYKGKGTSIYTVTPKAAEQVRQNVDDAEVITIFLMADEGTRYNRLAERTGLDSFYEEERYYIPNHPDLAKRESIYERIEKDKKIFSKCKCDYAVDANRAIEEVVANIKEIIEEEC